LPKHKQNQRKRRTIFQKRMRMTNPLKRKKIKLIKETRKNTKRNEDMRQSQKKR